MEANNLLHFADTILMQTKAYQFNAAPLRYLNEDQLGQIHGASLELIEDLGCRIHHQQARDLLQKNGARLEADCLVKIPPDIIEKALRLAPSTVTLYSRNGEPALRLENTNVFFGTGSDCQYVLDLATGKPRDFLFKDLKSAYKLVDALPHIDFVMGMGLAPDLEPRTAFQRKYAAMLQYTTKPQVLITGPGRSVLEDMVEIAAAAAGGRASLKNKPIFSLLVDPQSPLVHPEDALDKLIFMAEMQLPVIYAPGIMTGATSPVTMAGAIAQANAEILVGLAIHQLAAPGAPFIFGGGLSPMDMMSGQPTYSAPEAMIAQAGLCQLGRELYNLPTYGFGGCSASKGCDAQAINEAATYLMMSAWMGTNLVHDIGYIEAGMTYSLELMVLCDEIIGQIRRMMEGLSVDAEHLALDSIKRVGPGGSFLTDPHTLAHFRSNWMPDLTDRATRQTWEKGGSTTMAARARVKIENIIDTHLPEPLPAEILTKIEKIIHRARKPNQ